MTLSSNRTYHPAEAVQPAGVQRFTVEMNLPVNMRVPLLCVLAFLLSSPLTVLGENKAGTTSAPGTTTDHSTIQPSPTSKISTNTSDAASSHSVPSATASTVSPSFSSSVPTAASSSQVAGTASAAPPVTDAPEEMPTSSVTAPDSSAGAPAVSASPAASEGAHSTAAPTTAISASETSSTVQTSSTPAASAAVSTVAEATASSNIQDTTSSAVDASPTISAASSVSATPEESTTPESTSVPTSSSHPSASASPTPVTPSSTPVTPSPPPLPLLLINEVNLFLGKPSVNVTMEITGPYNTSTNVTVAIFDGKNGTVVHRKDMTIKLGTDGFQLIHIQLGNMTGTTYAVAVYLQDGKANTSVPLLQGSQALLDSLVVSSVHTNVSGSLQEIMLPEGQNLFVIKPEVLPAGDYSISRCGSKNATDQGAFVVTNSTFGSTNECSRKFGKKIQLKLPDAECGKWKADRKLVANLLSYMVDTMNKACQCGVSRTLFSNQSITCGSVIFEAYLSASFSQQADEVTDAYVSTVANSSLVIVGGRNLTVDPCSATSSCNVLHPVSPSGDKNNGDIKVTITVVVCCIALFVIIVIAVVIYMKKKRKGILQFRMTRLDEDDDLIGDMDDFVGGSGEPSFSNPLYGRRR